MNHSIPADIPALDVQWVRQQFSLPDDVAFFDNAGGSFTLRRVIQRVCEYMQETPIQLGASHALSQRAAERQSESLSALARLVDAPVEGLVAGPSASALVDRLGRALVGNWKPGDRVVVTDFDHEANISPWLRLREKGVEVDTWRLNRQSLRPEIEDLKALLRESTRLVACTQCSNVLGEAVELKDVTAAARSAGAQVMVDGVAYAPHRPVGFSSLDVDYYVLSLYKVFGPHIGLLIGKPERLRELSNINLEHLSKNDVPYKMQPGGACYELVYGAAGIEHYLVELGNGSSAAGWQAIQRHESLLTDRFLEGLREIPGVRILGAAHINPARLPIFSFTVDGHSSKSIISSLDQQKLYGRHGNFHAVRLIDAVGLDRADGAVRLSFAHYNSVDEVECLLGALRQIVG